MQPTSEWVSRCEPVQHVHGVCTCSVLFTSLNPIHITPSNLHNGTSIQNTLYTKKIHIDVAGPFRRMISNFLDYKSSISCSCLERVFTRILENSSHTADRLKFSLTTSFFSLFHTTFVLYIFCFDDRIRVNLHLLLDCANVFMCTC